MSRSQEGEQAIICMMAKAPVAGRVKTRLSPPLSAGQAAQLATAFALDTWQVVSSMTWARPVLAYAGRLELFPPAVAGAESFEQTGGSLGERIEAVATQALSLGAPAIIVGSDLPGLPTSAFERARQLLGTHDAVLGPSTDGGYYLIGLWSVAPGMLDGIPWSAATTRSETRRRLGDAGMSVAMGDNYDDIDEPEDLVRLKAAIEAGTVKASATEAALSNLP